MAKLSTSAWRSVDVRVGGATAVHDPPPDARGVDHVRLVDRAQSASTGVCELERAPHNALDLGRVVLAGVEDGAVVAQPTRPEIQATDELTHDHEIDVALPGGAQVGIDVERLAECERPASGRGSAPSQRGPPTAPSNTASAARHASSVSGGNGSPRRRSRLHRTRARRPRHRAGSAASTRSACVDDLGPDAVSGQADDARALPSPVSARAGRSTDARHPAPKRAAVGFAQVVLQPVLARGVAQRDAVLRLYAAQLRDLRMRWFTIASSRASSAAIRARCCLDNRIGQSCSCRYPQLLEQLVDVGVDLGDVGASRRPAAS